MKSAFSQNSLTVALLTRRMYNGGIERVVSLLIPILNKAGYQTILLTNEPKNEMDYPIPVEIKRYVLHSGVERLNQLETVLKKERVDVLFCHDYYESSLLDELKTAKKLGIKTLTTWHSVFSTQIAFNDSYFAEKFYAALSSDMIQTLSRTDEYFFRCCGGTAEYVPDPIPFQVQRTSPRGKAKTVPVILFPARIAPQKNPLDAIRIFAEVHKVIPSAVMKIAGADSFPELDAKVVAQIKKLGLQNFVSCLGQCNDMQSLYDEADIMLMTSELEGFALTLIEAKANALPIVAYDLPYLETMRPDTGVVTVEHGNIPEAAKQVVHLLQTPDFYQKTSEEGLSNAREFISFDFVSAYKTIFEKLFHPEKIQCPVEGQKMLFALTSSIKQMRQKIEEHATNFSYLVGYKDGRKDATLEITSGLTHKIGRIFTWLPVKLKRFLNKE